MSDAETRPVLIGEAPSKPGDRYHFLPLSGAVARTLCTLSGIPPQAEGSTYGRWTWALYERFECRNVFERYRDATPWSAPAARSRVEAILDDLSGRVVVCLGRKPHKALYDAVGGTPPAFHLWDAARFRVAYGTMVAAAIPHPSGLNRSLNDPEERERAGATLRRALELAARPARDVAS